jgi:8-oxo-dGTP pyrophosphatase MutT (NUDIX family)
MNPLRARLAAAAHRVDAPPTGPAWNLDELDDVLPSELTPAAVLVPVVLRAEGAGLILTRRTEQLKHHAGQISFPGGRVEAHDASPLAAALRETEEEIGIGADRIEALGYLDPFATITGFVVTPVLAIVDPGYRLRIDPSEVADAFEIDFAAALDPARQREEERDWRGRVRRYHVIAHDRHLIWGATASMIVNLGRRVRACTED